MVVMKMFRKKKTPEPATTPQGVATKARPRRQLKLLLIGVLVLVLAGGALYLWYGYRNAINKGPTVEVNGKEVPALFMKDALKPTDTSEPVDFEAEVRRLEAKIAAGSTDYLDYLALAQAYVSTGNKEKAIDNYGKAKQAADPNMEYYQSFIESTDAIIKELRESS